MSKDHEKSDMQEVREMMDSLTDKVPQLIRGVLDSLYTKEAGASMGQSVGAYYQELIAAGLPQEAALEMTKEYSFSLKQVMSQSSHGDGGSGGKGRGGFSFTYSSDKEKDRDDPFSREQG